MYHKNRVDIEELFNVLYMPNKAILALLPLFCILLRLAHGTVWLKFAAYSGSPLRAIQHQIPSFILSQAA